MQPAGVTVEVTKLMESGFPFSVVEIRPEPGWKGSLRVDSAGPVQFVLPRSPKREGKSYSLQLSVTAGAVVEFTF